MRILANTYAVFWRTSDRTVPGWQQHFHADMGKLHPCEPASAVVARFRDLFPGDAVVSVRDGTGRFVAYRR